MQSSRLTKIIATLGPASWDVASIEALIHAGTNVFRINCSHSDINTRGELINTIRSIAKKLDKRIGILLDLQGPKIRVGKVTNNQITLQEKKKVIVTAEEMLGTEEKFRVVNLDQIIDDLKPGNKLLLDDGLLELRFLKKIDNNNIEC